MVIILNGKFDILTVGHINLLNHARLIAGEDGQVIVAIDTDRRISDSNINLPIFNQEVRAEALRLLRWCKRSMVDTVVYFDTDDELRTIIKKTNPDFMVKGTDWYQKEIVGKELVKIAWFPVTTPDGNSEKISSSSIVQAVLNKYQK